MTTKQKDFLERLLVTVVLAAISFGIVWAADVPEVWALGILAVLQAAKNLIAREYGDPETGGFTDTTSGPVAEAVATVEGVEGI